MWLSSLVERLAKAQVIDRVAEPLKGLVHRVVGQATLKDLLSGKWLGHPLHPMLTDVPIGSFTSATVLDLVGGARSQRAADVLVGLGLASAVPTVAAGLADWSDTDTGSGRIGVVHAFANGVGLGCYAASLVARARGRRGPGVALGLAGMTTMTVGGYLGGHLVLARNVGANAAAYEPVLDTWMEAAGMRTVGEGGSGRVEVAGAAVLVDRTTARIRAIGDICTHAGGPLHEGEIDSKAGCVTCPWHASVFNLADGEVLHGPATVAVAAYEAREADDKIQIRRRS